MVKKFLASSPNAYKILLETDNLKDAKTAAVKEAFADPENEVYITKFVEKNSGNFTTRFPTSSVCINPRRK